MRSSTSGSTSAPMGHPVPPNAPVQFSLLYRLHHTACSITARNSTSPLRLSGSSSSSPYAPFTAGADANAAGYVTPPQSRTHAIATTTGPYPHPPVSSSPTSSPPATWSPSPRHRMAGDAGQGVSSTPLLSTMDKRELSKVVVRDAVYARVLDLVPGRQHVQVAVWTLSPHIIQIDGAVAVAAPLHDSEGFLSSFSTLNESDFRRVVQERLHELAVDASLFASLLQPYLGDVGCRGDIVTATVDGVQC
ncbi:unspecified product [Leptomonas pyrrhocoris]|uniref:Unspecified product n=1 Tax=Leptomonas pyrrhocoris TaxID=157538 RepID=A0A0M9G8J0_LEPPY|nr:unspecified product [Leptomonas pyrrhocoris]KPA84847.1 unspecified product [Leptomonas pyrrhocoris]|eukprot:XP_015663286.1 unspecified product [Leptomonas pyrrhocoris]